MVYQWKKKVKGDPHFDEKRGRFLSLRAGTWSGGTGRDAGWPSADRP
jgi:hypothetical protein